MSVLRIHGGPDAQGVPLHDFSTNSNACGPCPLALAAVQGADATRYPDATYTELRAQLAARHGVAPERVLLAGSASEFIFRISAWVAQQADGSGSCNVWLPPQHYGDYAAAAQAWGLTRVAQPQGASLAWACDPSSPLGQAQGGLAELVATAPVVVLDRAYEPLRLSAALALTQEQLLRVWQLWTPNKALGLTGVRAAYVIAPLGALEAVAQLERLAPSWLVGAHGVALLRAWLLPEVQAWLQQSLTTLREWKARQLAVCEALGWTCLPSNANYFCARPDVQGEALTQALATLRAQGIKLRDATSFGLPGHVRLGVLAPQVQDALQQAWVSLRAQERTSL
ncbi:MAG: aminotransferase [Curvibacter sp. PD_MW3]|nr:MAG: aminotransferase [Curvibacter sp. PD_MW3]